MGLRAYGYLAMSVLLCWSLSANAAKKQKVNWAKQLEKAKQSSSDQTKSRFIYEFLETITPLTQHTPHPTISRCAAFSYSLSKLAELYPYQPKRVISQAIVMMSDASVVYSKMAGGCDKLGYCLQNPTADFIIEILMSEWNRAKPSGSAVSKQEFMALVQNDSAHLGNEEVKTLQTTAARNLAGLKSSSHSLGAWLNNHAGMSSEDRKMKLESHKIDLNTGFQIPAYGYRQDPDDHDGTGRHDHLLGNMLLGYATTTASKVWSNLGDQFCNFKNCSLPPETRAGAYLICQTQSALNWLIGEVAPGADEYFSSDQNGSSTDVKVNIEGVEIGRWLATLKPSSPIPAKELGNKIFRAICDEKQISPQYPGPLDDSILETLSSAQIKK